jgi:dihydroflavonol-4-reductase
MRILITGANGLVGNAACRQFLMSGHEVFAYCRANADLSLLKDILPQINLIEGNILDILSLEKAVQNMDYVVHAAAIVSFAPKDRQRMYKTNVEGTANVVNACLTNKNLKKLCFVSSIAALGRPANNDNLDKKQPIVINENQKWEDSPLNAHYAKTKYLAECEVWRGEAEGLNIVIVNPSVILGEGNWERSSTQLFKYIADGNKYYTLGTTNIVDIKDLVTIIEKLIFSEVKGERFIVNNISLTYKDLFDKIADALHKPRTKYKISAFLAEIIWRFEAIRSFLTGSTPLITKETAKTSRTIFAYNNTKIQQTLHFEFTPIDQTIQRVSEWISQNQGR